MSNLGLTNWSSMFQASSMLSLLLQMDTAIFISRALEYNGAVMFLFRQDFPSSPGITRAGRV